MKRKRGSATTKQYAYAMRSIRGEGETKKERALLCGYAPSVAENVHDKIEKTEGFHNAMVDLALKSQNLVLAAMHEFEARGLKNFSNKDLVSALNAISTTWERFNKVREPHKIRTAEGNPLRAAVLQHVENQTVVVQDKKDIPTVTTVNEPDSVEVPAKSTIVPETDSKPVNSYDDL